MIYCDNQSAIRIATNEKSVHRTRHMSVQANYQREQIENGTVDVTHVKSDKQLADMLTKPTTIQKFILNTNKLMNTLIRVLCITIFLMAGLDIKSEAYLFERVNPMIWIPADNHVEISTTVFNLDLTYESPCERYLTPKAPLTLFADSNSSPMTILKDMKISCESLFKEHWQGKMKELLEMKSPNLIETPVNSIGLRKKRFIDPFTLIFEGVALGVVIVTNIVSSIVSEVVP